MKIITLPRSVVIDAAKVRGVSACEEINRLLTASLGFEVCSHFIREDAAIDKAVFSLALLQIVENQFSCVAATRPNTALAL